MKKFMGWMLVLSLGMFIVGCGEEKKDPKKADAKPPAGGADSKKDDKKDDK